VIPTPRLIWLGCALAASAVFLAHYPQVFHLWLILPAVLAACCAFDLLAVYRIKLSGNRKIRNIISHGQWSDITIEIANIGNSKVDVRAHDMHPQLCKVRGLPRAISIDANAMSSLRYEALPEVRGEMVFDAIDCQVSSGMKLWYRQMKVNCLDKVKVYPNFKSNKMFGILLSKRNLDHLGIRRLPRPGEGSDFHQLREYRDGDSLKQIDWKATARTQKLITREYAQERDQQIVFLVDCSMRMRHQDDTSSQMDDKTNAIVLLTLRLGGHTGATRLCAGCRNPGRQAKASCLSYINYQFT